MSNLTRVSVFSNGSEIARGVLAAGRNVIVYTPIDKLPKDDTPVQLAVNDHKDLVPGLIQRVKPGFVGVYLDAAAEGPYEYIDPEKPKDEPATLHAYIAEWARRESEPGPATTDDDSPDVPLGPVGWWCKYICGCC